MNFKFIESDRFKVAPSCPCGKSNKDGKFAPIILDGKPAPAFGHCHSCGISFFPNGHNRENKPDPFIEPVPKKEIRYVDAGIVQSTLRSYHINNFARWLKEKYPTLADYLLARFSVGTTKNGGTIFWYQNIHSNYCKPKRIFYKPDGHRVKTSKDEYKSKPSPIIFTSKAGYEYCLFGEFQLASYPQTAKIVIVESEKSAIIGHAHFPDYIWLATGGAVSLKMERAMVLKKRKVIILPDMHQAGREGAFKTQSILTEVGCESTIQDLDKNREDGLDIVDIYNTSIDLDHFFGFLN